MLPNFLELGSNSDFCCLQLGKEDSSMKKLDDLIPLPRRLIGNESAAGHFSVKCCWNCIQWINYV